MLIILDNSLLGSIASNPSPFNPTTIVIDLVAEAIRRGTHIICADVATFDGLIEKNDLFQERTRQLLIRARTKLAFRQGLISGVLWRARITSSVTSPITKITADGQRELLLPTTLVANSPTLLNRPRFIPENNNDGHFFEALVYNLIELDKEYKNNFSTVVLNFDLLQGGGQTTSLVYAHEKNSKGHFCLAVVDSDQSSPTGPIGNTAKAVIAIDSPPNTLAWNARHLVLGVRAVENLFPRQTLLKAATELDKALGVVAENVVETHSGKPHWFYIHLKNGLRCYDIKPVTTPDGHFVRNALNFAGCPNPTGAPCVNRESCGHTIINALGDKLLAQVCREHPVKVKIDMKNDAQLMPHIKSLAKEMLTMFCGDAPAI